MCSGSVLTAIVTPFRRGRVGRLRRVPAARAAPRRERLRRHRRRRHDRREPDADATASGSISSAPRSRRSARTRPSSQAPAPTRPRTRCSSPSAHTSWVPTRFLVVTPYYNKPPQRGIVAHFEAIARASDRPIVVYNIPARVVVNIEPETISRLAEIETVRAVKQANDDLAQARHIVTRGSTSTRATTTCVQPFLELGGIGGICVHTHVVGPQVAEQVRAALGRRLERGRELDRELAARLRAAADPDEPDPDQGRAEPARPRVWAATACRSSAPTERRGRRRACAASSGSASSSRLTPPTLGSRMATMSCA